MVPCCLQIISESSNLVPRDLTPYPWGFLVASYRDWLRWISEKKKKEFLKKDIGQLTKLLGGLENQAQKLRLPELIVKIIPRTPWLLPPNPRRGGSHHWGCCPAYSVFRASHHSTVAPDTKFCKCHQWYCGVFFLSLLFYKLLIQKPRGWMPLIGGP